MAKTCDRRSDGLEIVSIGKLSSGPWEKKYWSSTRGKDRYPYPIGFKAVRTQNGITYTMEISEGLKGPLFTISSSDGLSCSGHTPDIAWESFQKKGSSRPKLWRGKRFLCKIDGMELFGFKNAFVQRLLRELLANVGGAVEPNLLPSCISDKSSETGDAIRPTNLTTYPNLLPYLEIPGGTRKRSRKEKMISINPNNAADLKNDHAQGQGHNADASNDRQSCQENNYDTCFATISSSYQNEVDKKAEALRRSGNFQPTVKDENLLVSSENHLHMNSLDVSDRLKADGTYTADENKPTTHRNYMILEGDGNLQKDKKIINCFLTNDEEGEGLEQSNMRTINDSQLCAPDTFDESPDMPISEVLMTESCPEDRMDACSSNPSSEKADFDSASQEIANSMMTVLLPRALPLLKTFSRRKRNKNKLKPPEKSTCISITANRKTVDLLPPELEETSDLNQNRKEGDSSGTTNPSVGHLESFVPDSFDNNGSEDTSIEKLCSFPDIMLEDETLVDAKTFQHETILEAETVSPACHIQATDSITELVPKLGSHGVGNLGSKSSTDFKIPCEGDTSMIFGQHASFIGHLSPDGNAKTLPDCIAGVPDPANACQENFETRVEKDLAEHKVLPELYRSEPDLQNQAVSCSTDTVQAAQEKEVEDGSKLNDNVNRKHNGDLEDVLKFVSCYIHHMPILEVLLSTVGNDIFLCVLCGSPAQENKVLIVYNAPVTGETTRCPSLIGHSSVLVPILKDSFGRNIALENSGLQFTPGAQSLVLVNSIKVPCCREGNIHCPCSSCTSDCSEENALKIVQVKVGYVSVVTKLKTTQTVRCLLVCEPNHLLAVDESGKFYLWVMDSNWSGHMDECYLSLPDHMASSLVELKRIPNSPALVVGHNGFGEFGLWDIDKRILISKFSSPSTSISKCVPISLFQWQRKGNICTYFTPEKLIDEVLDATNMSFSRNKENSLALPIENEDVAIWLLISTISGPDFPHGYQSDVVPTDNIGHWRLALLVKDIVIMGNALDVRAAVIGASSGHGIIGRSDGLVYMWDFSTGAKIGNLHHFEGSGVSCIATDSSNSGALAVASEEGQLLVYMHS